MSACNVLTILFLSLCADDTSCVELQLTYEQRSKILTIHRRIQRAGIDSLKRPGFARQQKDEKDGPTQLMEGLTEKQRDAFERLKGPPLKTTDKTVVPQ